MPGELGSAGATTASTCSCAQALQAACPALLSKTALKQACCCSACLPHPSSCSSWGRGSLRQSAPQPPPAACGNKTKHSLCGRGGRPALLLKLAAAQALHQRGQGSFRVPLARHPAHRLLPAHQPGLVHAGMAPRQLASCSNQHANSSCAAAHLLLPAHEPGLVDAAGGHALQLRHPRADVVTLRVVVLQARDGGEQRTTALWVGASRKAITGLEPQCEYHFLAGSQPCSGGAVEGATCQRVWQHAHMQRVRPMLPPCVPSRCSAW